MIGSPSNIHKLNTESLYSILHLKWPQEIFSDYAHWIWSHNFSGSKIHYCWLDSHMFSATQMSRSPFGRFHPVIDAENLAQQILTRQISPREGVGWSGCEILTIDRYAFHDDDGHASEPDVLSWEADFCFFRSRAGSSFRVGRSGKAALFTLLTKGVTINISKY